MHVSTSKFSVRMELDKMLNSDLATGNNFPQKNPYPILPNLFFGVSLKLLHILNS